MRDPIYIAGPMTGLPDNNYPAFDEAAETLRGFGYRVENPTINGLGAPENADWHWYMRAGIRQLLRCRSIVMLPGWAHSRGARIERQIAIDLDFEVYEWERRREWILLTPFPLPAER